LIAVERVFGRNGGGGKLLRVIDGRDILPWFKPVTPQHASQA